MTAGLQAVTEGRTMTTPGRLDAGLSPLGLGFEPCIVYLGFMVDKLTVDSTCAVHCQYHSTTAPYTAIHLFPMPVMLAIDCVVHLDSSRKMDMRCK